MMSLKRHFLKKFSKDFSEILVADVKLMLWEGTESVASISAVVLELSRKSGRGGGAIFAPSPSGARVNIGEIREISRSRTEGGGLPG